jgi:hypothetical protein
MTITNKLDNTNNSNNSNNNLNKLDNTNISNISNISNNLINYKVNDIKYAIKNNDPIENKLNIIVVISNPCLYKRRYVLYNEFISRLEFEDNVNIYTVELIYSNTELKNEFYITKPDNPNHLQLHANNPLWHKENMINLAVKKLLPKNYKAFAWIDADIEFESVEWVSETLKILNGCKDVVQLFSHCIDMDINKLSLNVFSSFGYSFSKNKPYVLKSLDYWHPGFAWAITRKAYEKIGGLYEVGILGSGDSIMALSFINKVSFATNKNYSNDYNNSMYAFQKKASNLRLGYVPGIIRHYYHGSKQNRKYTERWLILMKHNYSPKTHLKYNNGIINIDESEFSEDIYNYFKERKEDE